MDATQVLALVRVPNRPRNDNSFPFHVSTVFRLHIPGRRWTRHFVRFEGPVSAIVLGRALKLLTPNVRGNMSKQIRIESDRTFSLLIFEGDRHAPATMCSALRAVGINTDVHTLVCRPGQEAAFQNI